jgi:Aldehyde dehydrogenase family
METGMVFINYPDLSLPELPFGGVKRSGYGKELSSLGIEEFVNRKLIFRPERALVSPSGIETIPLARRVRNAVVYRDHRRWIRVR